MERSLALSQGRERGAWSAYFDELWVALTARYGRSEAAEQMVDVLSTNHAKRTTTDHAAREDAAPSSGKPIRARGSCAVTYV
jgi:hypothetical protein